MLLKMFGKRLFLAGVFSSIGVMVFILIYIVDIQTSRPPKLGMEFANQTALALLPISLIGAVLNWSILYSIYKLSFFKNSFGYLSANQAFMDAFHSTIFLIYFCPMVLLDQKVLKEYSYLMGPIALFCYQTSVLTHFVISINRSCAAWVPFKYERWFGIGHTKKIIALLWVINASICVSGYLVICRLGYIEEIHFIYTNSESCGKMAWYDSFVKNAALVAIIICIDVTTILRVRHVTKKVNSLYIRDEAKFTARDIRFLKQTVLQGSVFLLELLTYFLVPKYIQNQWMVFFGTSFAWVAVHVADGMVVVVCNPEIRRYLLGNKKFAQTPQPNIKSDITNSSAPHGLPNFQKELQT